MIPGVTTTTTCFSNATEGLKVYSVAEDIASSSMEPGSGPENHSTSLLYCLSMLKERVHQVQSLVGNLVGPDQSQPAESTSFAVANMASMVQEIIMAASSMLFTCQQISSTLGSSASGNNNNTGLHQQHANKVPDSGLTQLDFDGNNLVGNNIDQERGQVGFNSGETFGWFGDSVNCYNYNNCKDVVHHDMHTSNETRVESRDLSRGVETSEGSKGFSSNYDLIELDAADLLAKYTHYCQVCGKGFKRDANLRMHMRAHGDEYKTNAALINPLKYNGQNAMGNEDPSMKIPRKYSCPQEGCRWNRKHAKFQPLKSMICVKNHYKRSHCPKMYVCKQCNRKHFAVLSDLRTHEKHCGELKWQCSCGTTFSRKDKLMGHVSLFVGHTPAMNTFKKPGKVEYQVPLMQYSDDSVNYRG